LNFVDLFPTTIAVHKLTSLDVGEALERVKELSYVDDQSNRGQYTQDQDVLADPYFANVCAEIEAACADFAKEHGHRVEGVGICSSWANRIPNGNRSHNHR